MANREKGEGTLVLGKEKYTLVLNTMAWAQAQDALTHMTADRRVEPLEEIERKLAQESLIHWIALLWAMFQKHHPTITIDQAADLFNRDERAITAAVLSVLGMAAPDPADVKELAEGKTNPSEAQATPNAGTGEPSISTPDVSA